MTDELKFLELLEEENPFDFDVDFWKFTDESRDKISKFIDAWHMNNQLEFPIDLEKRLLEEVKYFDKNGVKMDGTEPEDFELEFIKNPEKLRKELDDKMKMDKRWG